MKKSTVIFIAMTAVFIGASIRLHNIGVWGHVCSLLALASAVAALVIVLRSKKKG